MNRSTLIFIIFLGLLASLLGYNYFFHPFADRSATDRSQIIGTNELAPSPSPELLMQLTAREQIVQLVAFPYLISAIESTQPAESIQSAESTQSADSTQPAESTQSASLDWIKTNQPAVVVLFGEKISTPSALMSVNKINSAYPENTRPLIGVDHEGGSVQRLSGAGFTRLPNWQTLCASSALPRQELLKKSAQELAGIGVNIIFAPVIDVASQSAVLGNRVCSARAETVVSRATELIDIFHNNQILPVIKHFPGIGGVEVDLHHNFATAKLVPDDILVFKELLATYPNLGVMSTHVGVKGLYEDVPCSLNPDCMGDLRDFFPEALVFSDALDMDSAGYRKDAEELISFSQRAINALLAGNDVLIFGPKVTPAEIEEIVAELVRVYEVNPQLQDRVQSSLAKLWLYKKSLQP